MVFTTSRSLFQKAFLLLTMGIGFFLIGCKDSPTWSTESLSSDGKMVATARSYAGGGFGASGPSVTLVYLNWTTGSQKPMQIFGLHDESDKPEETRIGMRWLTPAHLEITYNAKAQAIDFQAMKFAGVDISLRDVSSEAAKPTQ